MLARFIQWILFRANYRGGETGGQQEICAFACCLHIEFLLVAKDYSSLHLWTCRTAACQEGFVGSLLPYRQNKYLEASTSDEYLIECGSMVSLISVCKVAQVGSC